MRIQNFGGGSETVSDTLKQRTLLAGESIQLWLPAQHNLAGSGVHPTKLTYSDTGPPGGAVIMEGGSMIQRDTTQLFIKLIFKELMEGIKTTKCRFNIHIRTTHSVIWCFTDICNSYD